MDFKGQKLAEVVSVWIVTVFAIAGFLWGYATQDFGAMMKVFTAGCALAFAASVPDWPAYNKHPVQWLAPKEDRAGGKRGGGGQAGGGGEGGRAGGPKRKKAASWSNLWGMMPSAAVL